MKIATIKKIMIKLDNKLYHNKILHYKNFKR